MRNPRTHGLPPRFPGSIVMRSRYVIAPAYATARFRSIGRSSVNRRSCLADGLSSVAEGAACVSSTLTTPVLAVTPTNSISSLVEYPSEGSSFATASFVSFLRGTATFHSFRVFHPRVQQVRDAASGNFRFMQRSRQRAQRICPFRPRVQHLVPRRLRRPDVQYRHLPAVLRRRVHRRVELFRTRRVPPPCATAAKPSCSFLFCAPDPRSAPGTRSLLPSPRHPRTPPAAPDAAAVPMSPVRRSWLLPSSNPTRTLREEPAAGDTGGPSAREITVTTGASPPRRRLHDSRHDTTDTARRSPPTGRPAFVEAAAPACCPARFRRRARPRPAPLRGFLRPRAVQGTPATAARRRRPCAGGRDRC